MRTLCLFVAIAIFSIGLDRKADSETIDFVLQRAQYAPHSFGIPNTIGEYDVLAVLTNDNFACMRTGEKRLILRTRQPRMLDALSAFSKQRLRRDLQALGLAGHAQWGFDIVGPGIMQQQLLGQVAESYRVFKTNPCIRLRKPLRDTRVPAAGGEDKHAPPFPGFAIIENVDAGSYTDDNAQSVFFIAPVVGTNQQGKDYSALLNNVWTNAGYFLQVGFAFQENVGYVVWADSSVDDEGQVLPVPYQANHLYGTLISFQSGMWWMCAGDYENVDDTWSCHGEPKATGTNLQRTINTSIFAENWNTTPEWFSGFSNRWTAFQAKIYRNGTAQDWSSQETWTRHACSDQWLPENVIAGSLANDGVAYFDITELPVYCE